MNGDELGRALEDRLTRVIPVGFRVVYSDDGVLRYSSDAGRVPGQTGIYQVKVGSSGTYVRHNLASLGGHPEDIVSVCRQALDELQDYIDEATHDPWPGDRAPPRPYAEIRGAEVLLGYGTPDTPVLEIEPIRLDLG